MREDVASRTAGWVASARSFGRFLPQPMRLADDPFGIRFGEPILRGLYRAFERRPGAVDALWWPSRVGVPFVRYMQLRTRYIDDALRAFVAGGGRQVVLLGAGYDARALRLGPVLDGARFFEVDHPATQALKRALLPELAGTDAQLLDWDFMARPLSALPVALSAAGHDASAPTCTIWEGVSMYLDLPAIEATLAAVGAYSAPGSALVFNYMDRALFGRARDTRERALSALVARVGEPFRFGWVPAELPAWLAARGFSLREDHDAFGLASALLPPDYRRGAVTPDRRRFAIADRA